jgi:outer membrane protein assembly factor BamB
MTPGRARSCGTRACFRLVPSPAEGRSLENGVVYGGNANGAAYGFDAATGAQVWSAPTGGAGGSTTPVVVNGMVYIGNGNAGQLVAFNLP